LELGTPAESCHGAAEGGDKTGDFRDSRRDLTRAWTERLYAEYEQVLYHFRVKMRPPVIEIVDTTSKWGSWSPTVRRLTISRKLIEAYSWDVVIEVLKHEMAHQLVSEVLGKIDQHGPHFRRACERLGVAAWAAASGGDLPTSVTPGGDRALGDFEERLLKRAEKLLALAESANEHEAALAMQRVRELYARSNLERLATRRSAPLTYAILNYKKRRVDSVDSLIVAILTEHFFVKAIYTTLWDPRELVEHKAVELLGTKAHVAMAEYVAHFLNNQLQLLWNDFKGKTGSSGVTPKRSYMLGVLTGFREKLAAQAPDVAVVAAQAGGEATCQALLRIADQELESFVARRHPRLAKRSWGGGQRDSASFNAGKAAGAKLTLHKGVNAKAGNLGRFLPGKK
jgi:hypothetical protein